MPWWRIMNSNNFFDIFNFFNIFDFLDNSLNYSWWLGRTFSSSINWENRIWSVMSFFNARIFRFMICVVESLKYRISIFRWWLLLIFRRWPFHNSFFRFLRRFLLLFLSFMSTMLFVLSPLHQLPWLFLLLLKKRFPFARCLFVHKLKL